MKKYAMNRRSLAASLAALMLCALPLSAQVAGEGGAASMTVRHAEIGTLAGVDAHGVITTSYPTGDAEYAHRTYRSGPTTAVEGLGGIMSVNEIPATAYGRVVVVEFTQGPNMERPMAQRLQFPTAREIEVTRGTIVGIDQENHRLTLANVDGFSRMDLGIGYGVTIDSNTEGILELDDLAYGQQVAVYYADEQNSKTAYLIMRSD